MRNSRSDLRSNWLLLAIVLSLGGCSEKAEWVLSGAEIISGGQTQGPVGIAVKDGRIVCRGEVAAWENSATRRVDVTGKTLLPGIVDHHVHLLNVGAAVLNRATRESLFLDLSAVESLDELTAKISSRTAALPEGNWILGQGWNQARLDTGAMPGLEPISLAAPRHPVYLTRVDGHAGWANATALRIAGISRSTADPPGGKILRDSNGEPTGVLLETANDLMARRIPTVEPDVLERCFQAGASALASAGVTEVYDAGFLYLPGVVALEVDHHAILAALVSADQEAPLPVDVHLMVPAPTSLWQTIVRDPERFQSLSPRLGVSHVKLFADGALGSRGAFLSHDFHDDPGNRGIRRHSREELAFFSRQALGAGFGVAIHAIGDAAVAGALDVYEEILFEDPDINPGRLRVEHFSYAGPEDQQRAARLGILLSVQPNFVAPDDQGRTMEDARLGTGKTTLVYAWQTLRSLGTRLAFGSDYFAIPGPTLLNFFCATTRENLSGLPPGGWHPDQRLSRSDSMSIQTASWRPSGEMVSRGLSVGEEATFSIASANPLTVSEDEILRIRVHAAFRKGSLVYHDGSIAGLR